MCGSRSVVGRALGAASMGLVWLTLQACSGAGGPEAGVPPQPGQDGLVRVEIERRDGSSELGLTTRFLRFREVDRATADLLAGGEPVVAEGCQPPAGPPPLEDVLALLPDAARVEHLDAGEVSALFDGATVTAAPRRLPALSPWVGGVEYDQPTAAVSPVEPIGPNAVSEPRGDEVTVTGFGGEHIGAFDAQVALPPGRPSVRFDPDLVVTWSPGADDVIVTVDGASGPVCRGYDHGGLRIPAALLPPTASRELTLTVERIRRLPLAAPGMLGAELEVVVRDVLPVARP